jgi:hypothetical protein
MSIESKSIEVNACVGSSPSLCKDALPVTLMRLQEFSHFEKCCILPEYVNSNTYQNASWPYVF